MPPRTLLARLVIALVVAQTIGTAPAVCAQESRPVSIRVRWGGGTPQAWAGRINVLATDGGGPPRSEWRTLSTQRDAAASTVGLAQGILVNQPRPIANDGVEVTIHEWQRARLVVTLGPSAAGKPAVTSDLLIADLLAAPWQRPLDGEGNRLTIEQATGDALRVTLAEPESVAGRAIQSTWRPGERVRLQVAPLLLMKPGGSDVELRVRLSPARLDTAVDSRVIPLAAARPSDPTAAPGNEVPTAFTPVDVDLTLPGDEGVYDIVLDAVERRGLRWNRQLATSRVQIVALATDAPSRPEDEPWKVIYDLDPGSPRLHERLRRLPARGLQAVPRPTVAFPAMPLPTFSRPSLTMPRMPEVPLPSMSLPDVSSLVPRLGGLLASGHSAVAPHPLGPMLRLPPAASIATPAWEGIVIATPRAGVPHIVEIEYPTDQQATVAACVLEADPAGGNVEIRHAGGFEVSATPHDGPAKLATHRFVFWPTTRQPLLVISNPVTRGPALVGHVRVLAGPARLPKGDRKVRTQGPRELRQTFAWLPLADITQAYGGPPRPEPGAGRMTADWVSHLTAIRHSADAIAAQGLAGGVVTVYAHGAAAWPSPTTRSPPRWATAEAADGLDQDLLMVTAQTYAREGLAIVPALCFDGPIPSLESLRAEHDAAGIACVGTDGRPRKIAAGIHYNILDPRVQRAVEEITTEAADRLRGQSGVAGIAILLPDDGWLHLPGTAWGLDDVTFGRFLAAIGGSPAEGGDGRFAARGKLVTGSLRNEWLAWRSGELAAFYSRLTAMVGERVGCKLFVVPTTILTHGDVASRFRPTAAPIADQADLMRELGLVPSLPVGHRAGAMVFVPAHLAAAGLTVADRSTVATANTCGASAASAGGVIPRATAITIRPLELNLADVLPHGPFPAATFAVPCQAWIAPVSSSGDACLARALMTADAEVLFDMRASAASPSEGTASRGLEALPAISLKRLATLPASLMVRTGSLDGITWVQLVNAGPAPVEAVLGIGGSAVAVVDATSGAACVLAGGRASVSLAAWDIRSLAIDGGGKVDSVAAVYAPTVRTAIAASIERLRQRLGVLVNPDPLDVLDNPGFELGLAEATAPSVSPAVTGWELLEPRRGGLELVPGRAGPDGAGRSIRFSSRNGLSTVRSNPFGPPANGRISVAAWLRLDPGDPQPPLRIAIEGVEGNREYYRFAPVGGLTGGRPLSPEWALFVLQVDDLPSESIESLRVRFDLLGPGSVHVDEIRVFDLAFDEAQRAEIARSLALVDHRFKAGDLGAALVELEGHWPAFLEAFVSDDAVATRARAESEPRAAATAAPPEPRQGMLDRFRGWW